MKELSLFWGVVVLEVRFDSLILLVEVCKVGDEVLDHVHVRKGVNLGILGGVFWNSAQASKSVDTVNVHGTGTTDTLSARSSESKSGVELILDLDQSIEHHRAALGEIDLVCLELGLLIGDIGVPSVDLELLNWRLLSLNRSGELGRSGSVERPGGSGERSGGGRDSVQRTEDGGWADHNVCSMSLEVCMSGELCEKPEKQQV